MSLQKRTREQLISDFDKIVKKASTKKISSVVDTQLSPPVKASTAEVISLPVISYLTHEQLKLANIGHLQEQEKHELEKETAIHGEEFADMEEANSGENFVEYIPKKFSQGKPHPDILIESLSLGASIPPDITYSLKLPKFVINEGLLSSPQLETVVYASQIHETFLLDGSRKGFFLGDGAGVGKGRQLSGIIFENWVQGRKKHIWLSTASDLHLDSRRDLDDIRANIGQVLLRSLPFKEIKNFNEGVIFSTYSSLISSSRSNGSKCIRRIDHLIKWCGPDFDGCIVFDECHKAKNLVPTNGQPTKFGLAVLELQNSLPKARIVYCSATGVSEPVHLAYMVRLGLWGAGSLFPDGFDSFLEATRSSGIGLMELVAMHLKRTGHFLCRTLAFTGCEFKVNEDAVTDEQIKIYDAAAEIWIQLHHDLVCGLEGKMLDWYPIISDKANDGYESEDSVDSDSYDILDEQFDIGSNDQRPISIPAYSPKSFIMRYFWSAHQRFFRSLCISLKVPHAVSLAKQAVKDGKSVVIGLQSTGEAGTMTELSDLSDKKLTDFVSSPAASLKMIIFKLFPLPPSPIANAKSSKLTSKHIQQQSTLSGSKKRNSLRKFIDHDEESDDMDIFSAEESELQDIRSDESIENIKKSRLKKQKVILVDSDDEIDDDNDSMIEGSIEPVEIDSSLLIDILDIDESESVNEIGIGNTIIEGNLPVKDAENTISNNLLSVVENCSPLVNSEKSSPPKQTQISNWSIYFDEGWLIGDSNEDPSTLTGITITINGKSYIEYLNRSVRRKFVTGYSKGRIVAYLPKERNNGEELWHVVYEDNDEEDLNRKEMLRWLINEEKESLASSSKKADDCINKKVAVDHLSTPSFKKQPDEESDSELSDVSDNDDELNVCADLSFLEDVVVSESSDDDEKSDNIKSQKQTKNFIPVLSSLEMDISKMQENIAAIENDEFQSTDESELYLKHVKIRLEYLKKLRNLDLPRNPLDVLIDELGGINNVAEMTGRRNRIVRDPETGDLEFLSRSSNGITLNKQNIYERDEFMNGRKHIAIISEAASSGISLHADKRYLNPRRRVHITLELPWSADRSIQQLGRTHRSNQSSAPQYHLLISPQGGERRFAASVARRLESLGALTQGDRRATAGAQTISLEEFNLDNEYGAKALNALRKFIVKSDSLASLPKYLPKLPKDVGKDISMFLDNLNGKKHSQEGKSNAITTNSFVMVARNRLKQVGVWEDGRNNKSINVPKFLNRLLGLPSAWQRVIFDVFSNIYISLVQAAKREGSYDGGIMEIPGGLKASIENIPDIIWKPNSGIKDMADIVQHLIIKVDRSISWEESQNILKDSIIAARNSYTIDRFHPPKIQGILSGYYITNTKNEMNSRPNIVLAIERQSIFGLPSNVLIYRPGTGKHNMQRYEFNRKFHSEDVIACETMREEVKKAYDTNFKNYVPIDYSDDMPVSKNSDYLKSLWEDQIGNKNNIIKYHLLSGSVLNIWNKIEDVYNSLNNNDGRIKHTLRMARVQIPLSNIPQELKDQMNKYKREKSSSNSSHDESISFIGVYIVTSRIDEVLKKIQAK